MTGDISVKTKQPIRNGLGMGFMVNISRVDAPEFGTKVPVVRGMDAYNDIGIVARRVFNQMIRSEFLFDPYPESNPELHRR